MTQAFPIGFILESVGGPEVLVILVVVLILFGSKNLPKMARNLGKSMEEFRRAARDVQREIMTADVEEKPPLEINPPYHPGPDYGSPDHPYEPQPDPSMTPAPEPEPQPVTEPTEPYQPGPPSETGEAPAPETAPMAPVEAQPAAGPEPAAVAEGAPDAAPVSAPPGGGDTPPPERPA